jgi:hypothetical protein
MATSETSITAALQTLKAADPRLLEHHGYRLETLNYYSPLNNLQFLADNEDLWHAPFVPLDIDWREEHQFGVIREVTRYVHELADIPEHTEPGADFYWHNDYWNGADAVVQYGLLRSRKPRRLIEIGCGFSSLLAARAFSKNSDETPAVIPEVTLIEPYPRRELLDRLPSHWRRAEMILQRCPLEWFEELGSGDVLFCDSSHCSHTASDVNWLFFRILPRLREGVLIHLHDIFLPFSYPREWIFDRLQSWNEQFLLQAFLMNNSAYRVEIANAFTASVAGPDVKALYRDIQPFWGTSFWMTKVAK